MDERCENLRPSIQQSEKRLRDKKSAPEIKKESYHSTDTVKEVGKSENESELKKKITALTELIKNDSINKEEYIELIEDVIN